MQKDEDDNQYTHEERMTLKVLAVAGISHVVLNKHLVNVVQCQIYKILKDYKTASKKGGRQSKVVLEKFKTSSYKLKLYFIECNVKELKQENEQLRDSKRKIENDLSIEKCKVAKLKSDNVSWKIKFKSACKKLKMQQQKRVVYKPYSISNERHKRRLRNQFKSECEEVLTFFGLFDLIPTKVQYFDINSNQTEVLQLVDRLPNEIVNESFYNPVDTDQISMLLYIKDKFAIGDKAWRELSMVCKGVPSLYSIKQLVSSLNKNWVVFPTPGDSDGVQVGFKESVTKRLIQIENNGTFDICDVLKIKISGDGTNIGKRLKVVNITYTIINENHFAMSEKGNYPLAIVKCKEDYDGLKEALRDLREEFLMCKSLIH